MKSSPVISTIFGGATVREQLSNSEAHASRMIVAVFIRSHDARIGRFRQRCEIFAWQMTIAAERQGRSTSDMKAKALLIAKQMSDLNATIAEVELRQRLAADLAGHFANATARRL
jgi:hypothetical protein